MQKFDVVIIGNGVTAFSTAMNLSRAGISRIAMISSNQNSNEELRNSKMGRTIFGAVTLQDNISRFVHNHGGALTKKLLQINLFGFSSLVDYVNLHNIPHDIGEVLRFADSEHELAEIRVAVEWLQKNGFPSFVQTQGNSSIQHDGAAAIWVEYPSLLRQMAKDSVFTKIDQPVMSLTSNGLSERVTLASGEQVGAEMIVVTCQTTIKQLIPELETILVSHADQMCSFHVDPQIPRLSSGDLFYTQHSQFWGANIGDSTLICGGARYLRKWAGIEATHAESLPSITTAVKTKFERLLQSSLVQTTPAHGYLDIRTCDELPVIGPMFGNSRVLVASGFMNSGLTLGFAAGMGLTELITTGRSALIPEFLHPRRFRSLPSSDE